MRTKDNLNGLRSEKSRKIHPIHIQDNQLENPGPKTQELWKKDYVISSSNNKNTPKEDQSHTQISSGGRVALIIALAVVLAITALVAAYFVFRKRYGPMYTVRSFFGGVRPERDRYRDSKTSSVPLFIETEISRTEALPKRGSTKLKKPMQQSSGRRSSTKTNSSMMAGAVFAPGRGQTQDQPQLIQEPDPVRYSTQRSAISAGPSRLSTPSVTTWSSFLYMYSSTPPPQQSEQDQGQGHDNHNHNINSKNAMATTSRRKQPPSPLGPVPPYARNATDNQRALTPCSPCSNRTQVTTTTQSSGPIPSIYKLWIGRDASRASTTTPSGYGDCRWSYCQNHHHHRAGPSVVGSEDRVVSLPSPSPMLRNMIRPRGAPPVNTHVYQMMRQSPHGEQQARDLRQSHFWETDSYYCLKENEVPRSSRYGITGNVDDNNLPMLPRSVFAPNS